MSLTLDQLLATVSPDSPYAAIALAAEMRPTGPEGTKVAPPTYPPSPTREGPYLIDKRWIGGAEREVVTLDTQQSQGNRCEEGLQDAHDDGLVELPMFELLTDVDTDVGARTVRLTSLDLPHRYADAYLRDATLDGVAFDKTEIGKALRLAEPSNARALYEREPYSIVYGAWDSHRKGRQAKFPRVYDSTIIGFDPLLGQRAGGRLDPLNLTGAQQASGEDWDFVPEGDKKKGARLSEIGHGNALDSGGAHGHVAITAARRLATIHLAALRGIRFGEGVDLAATTAGRAALVALALLGDRLAFGRPAVFLRSGCELAITSETILLERPGGSDEPFDLGIAEAIELFRQAVAHAAEQGLAMATDRIVLTPKDGLAKAIAYAYTKAGSSGDGEG